MSDNFIESAVWADDIKERKNYYWSSWHYISKPINPDGVGFDNPVQKNNALTAINDTLKVLRNDDGYDLSTQKSMMLRFLIHVIGDIHQPLHASTFFSDEYPDGDMGGNKFYVTYKNVS